MKVCSAETTPEHFVKLVNVPVVESDGKTQFSVGNVKVILFERLHVGSV